MQNQQQSNGFGMPQMNDQRQSPPMNQGEGEGDYIDINTDSAMSMFL